MAVGAAMTLMLRSQTGILILILVLLICGVVSLTLAVYQAGRR